jgi:hypothetical protein
MRISTISRVYTKIKIQVKIILQNVDKIKAQLPFVQSRSCAFI